MTEDGHNYTFGGWPIMPWKYPKDEYTKYIEAGGKLDVYDWLDAGKPKDDEENK